ncbi:MAG TPA: heme-binding protein [Microbacteriaceae bacterium]|nr:heme-binding protein [Microbacteriaceae bacterium]
MSTPTRELAETLRTLASTPDALCERLTRHEEILAVPDFDVLDAWALGTAVRDIAVRESLPIAISIVFGTQRVFHAALPGASANNDLWAARKIAVVQLFNQSSFLVGADASRRGSSIYDRLSPADYADHGGAIPIRTRAGSLLGALAVSGLPSAHDHAVAVTALAKHLGVALEEL